MADASFEIAYDGEDVRDHSMDVLQLAPALLALGNLIRDTNALLNGDRSRVKVLVQSDFEHRCFSVSLDVIQSFFDHARALLDHKDTKTAREILEYLGLLGAPPLLTVLGYLRWRKGKKVESETSITDATGTGIVQLRLEDGSQAHINQIVYHIAERPEIKNAVARTPPVRPDVRHSVQAGGHRWCGGLRTKAAPRTQPGRRCRSMMEWVR